MKRENDLMLMVLGTLAFAVLVLTVMPKATDWSLSLSSKHDRPFGASLVKELFASGHTLTDGQTREIQQTIIPIFDFRRSSIDPNNATWFVLDALYDPDPQEVRQLLAYVASGMNAVIAGIPGRNLTDTLGIRVQRFDYDRPAYDYLMAPDTESRSTIRFLTFPPGTPSEMETLTLFNIHYIELEEDLFANEFERYANQEEMSDQTNPDSLANQPFISVKCELVGRRISRAESENKSVIMSVEYGAGQFLFIVNPLLLSNYHFWEPSLEPAASAVMAHIPAGRLLWDEYYKPGGAGYQTPLQHIIDHDALRPGYYVALFTLFLFMIFRAKREQRAIPMIPEPVNSTREYIRQVGHLLHGHDKDRKILDKRLLYLAHQLNLGSPEADDTELERACERYALDPDELRAVLAVWGKNIQSDRRLMDLNKRIETIYEQINSYGKSG
jgi:hypothetical protein